MKVQRCWLHKGQAVFHFEGVDSINAAEKLRGLEVQIPIEQRTELPAGKFFVSDLIGCDVWCNENEAKPTLSANPAERVGHPQTDVSGSLGAPLFAPGLREGWDSRTAVILLSASGRLFRQADARRMAQMERIILICGRYEGVDERVAMHLSTDEYSIGDLVLSGGELPAAMIIDAVTRLIPGALGNEDSAVNESFSVEGLEGAGDREQGAGNSVMSRQSQVTSHESPVTNHGILDYPHYTRPQEFRGRSVPEVLMSGNHEQIRRWRAEAALAKTRRNRPDLLKETGR
ncbi:MAG: hypothetical protein HY046_13470 [Acidobacteria bacterium]|nr:hypothetical protein [Acidobacteriota bacterium]